MKSEHKESKLYLAFFKDNLLIIIGLTLLLPTLLFFYSQHKGPKYIESGLLVMTYNQGNIEKKVTESDQAVSLLRAAEIQNQLGVDRLSKISVYKMAPMAITIDVENPRAEVAVSDLKKSEQFLAKNFSLVQAGQPVQSVKNFITPILVFISIGIGLFLGIILSLIRFYLKNY